VPESNRIDSAITTMESPATRGHSALMVRNLLSTSGISSFRMYVVLVVATPPYRHTTIVFFGITTIKRTARVSATCVA